MFYKNCDIIGVAQIHYSIISVSINRLQREEEETGKMRMIMTIIFHHTSTT